VHANTHPYLFNCVLILYVTHQPPEIIFVFQGHSWYFVNVDIW